MNNSNSRYNTYQSGRACGSRRLSESLSSNWVTVREGCGGHSCGGGYNDTEDVHRAAVPAEDFITDVEAAAEMAAAELTPEEEPAITETAPAGDAPDQEIPVITQCETPSVTSAGLNAYGCLYHKGSQRLVVSRPGDAVSVRFGKHSCLNGVEHIEGDDHVAVTESGDYEITFDLRVSAKASTPVMFELRSGNDTLPGGMFEFAISTGVRECRGGTMAYLQAGDRIGVVMTSVTVCEANLSSGGVSAMLRLKKLN